MALLILQRKLNTQHDKGFPFLLCYSYGDPSAPLRCAQDDVQQSRFRPVERSSAQPPPERTVRYGRGNISVI